MATSTQHTIRGTRDWLQCLAMRVKMMLMMTLIFVKCQWNKTFQYTYLLISVKAVFFVYTNGIGLEVFFLSENMFIDSYIFLIGNILGANQSLYVNYANFNMGHQINIQGEGCREVGGGFAKV